MRKKKPLEETAVAVEIPADTLDRIDRMILRHLQNDGRLTNTELADRVHLSPAACLERTRRLVRNGFIKGFHARLDPVRLGVGMLVFVQVILDRTTMDVFGTFKAAVQARPEILECYMVAGGFDYLVKARVRDMRAYRDFIAASLWSLPGVRETHTYAVMEEIKDTLQLPIV